MKENDIARMLAHCDAGINPSRELETDTASRMTEYSRPTPLTERVLEHPKVKKSGKMTLIIAAAFMCVVMLMGAGFRVFEHIFFLPGEGIVTDDFRDALVMEYATPMGTNYVEAASLVRNQTGGFDLTVITDVESRYRDDVRTLTLETADGSRITDKGAPIFEFANVPEQSSYTVYDDEGGSATIELVPIDSYEYAVYKYPVDHGVTLIMFPLSKGSQYLAYTTSVDTSAEPQNIVDLARVSEEYYVDLPQANLSTGIKITDINGRQYSIVGISGSWKGGKVDGKGFLNGQHFVKLDRRPTSEIATISLSHMSIKFMTNHLMPAQIITVPELDETVRINTPFVDKFGIWSKPESVTYKYTPEQKNDGKETWNAIFSFRDYRPMTGVDYVENVEVHYDFTNIATGALTDGLLISKYVGPDNPKLKWQDFYAGDHIGGDAYIKPGDRLAVTTSGVTLTISGDWVIDFTDKLDKPAPVTEAVESADIPA